MAEAQIVLSQSRESGIVATASGEHYRWAQTALAESGFRRDDDGVYHLPAGGNGSTVADLLTRAKRHRTKVRMSSRRFIGDAARDIAYQLPGQWDASVQIYSHPAWQEDLVPWIWDSGELGRALQNERIPYAATLTDTEHGITLLLIERPGHRLDYLVAAFASQGLEEGYADPHAPRSIVLPPFPGRAARAVADRYLPSYEQAVHARRTAAIATALGNIHSTYDTWQAMIASGRSSDATPLSAAALGATAEEFLDHTWRSCLTVIRQAPALIDRCRPTSSPWPEDAAALSRLAGAVSLLREVALSHPQKGSARAWPAIQTWLADGEIFLRQARVSAPHRRAALPVTTRPLPQPVPSTAAADRSPPRQREENTAPLQPGIHFAFGDHREHGFVASFTSSMPAHLAHWYLEREQFEPVPGEPRLYRLSEPERDGVRRTRQAVHDLRRHGYTVQADIRLDPALSSGPRRPVQANGLQERRSRVAQAATGLTTQHRATPPTTSQPAARPIPPKPSYAPTVHLTAPGIRRPR